MAVNLATNWNNDFKITGNGSSTPKRWSGGAGELWANITGTGTITLESCPVPSTTDADWVAVGTNTTLTASGQGGFTKKKCYLRITTTNASGLTAYYDLGGVGVGAHLAE